LGAIALTLLKAFLILVVALGLVAAGLLAGRVTARDPDRIAPVTLVPSLPIVTITRTIVETAPIPAPPTP